MSAVVTLLLYDRWILIHWLTTLWFSFISIDCWSLSFLVMDAAFADSDWSWMLNCGDWLCEVLKLLTWWYVMLAYDELLLLLIATILKLIWLLCCMNCWLSVTCSWLLRWFVVFFFSNEGLSVVCGFDLGTGWIVFDVSCLNDCHWFDTRWLLSDVLSVFFVVWFSVICASWWLIWCDAFDWWFCLIECVDIVVMLCFVVVPDDLIICLHWMSACSIYECFEVSWCDLSMLFLKLCWPSLMKFLLCDFFLLMCCDAFDCVCDLWCSDFCWTQRSVCVIKCELLDLFCVGWTDVNWSPSWNERLASCLNLTWCDEDLMVR